ncbi:hypothetical protein B484DRAFT_85851 [Ochromonadaceae sp. CCMP2298]|nr:hypothetical protein B484DRAFT_85851 [Ochromonadaceae sp. CCMP2298]
MELELRESNATALGRGTIETQVPQAQAQVQGGGRGRGRHCVRGAVDCVVGVVAGVCTWVLQLWIWLSRYWASNIDPLDPLGRQLGYHEMCNAIREGKLCMGIVVTHAKVAGDRYVLQDADYDSADDAYYEEQPSRRGFEDDRIRDRDERDGRNSVVSIVSESPSEQHSLEKAYGSRAAEMQRYYDIMMTAEKSTLTTTVSPIVSEVSMDKATGGHDKGPGGAAGAAGAGAGGQIGGTGGDRSSHEYTEFRSPSSARIRDSSVPDSPGMVSMGLGRGDSGESLGSGADGHSGSDEDEEGGEGEEDEEGGESAESGKNPEGSRGARSVSASASVSVSRASKSKSHSSDHATARVPRVPKEGSGQAGVGKLRSAAAVRDLGGKRLAPSAMQEVNCWTLLDCSHLPVSEAQLDSGTAPGGLGLGGLGTGLGLGGLVLGLGLGASSEEDLTLRERDSVSTGYGAGGTDRFPGSPDEFRDSLSVDRSSLAVDRSSTASTSNTAMEGGLGGDGGLSRGPGASRLKAEAWVGMWGSAHSTFDRPQGLALAHSEGSQGGQGQGGLGGLGGLALSQTGSRAGSQAGSRTGDIERSSDVASVGTAETPAPQPRLEHFYAVYSWRLLLRYLMQFMFGANVYPVGPKRTYRVLEVLFLLLCLGDMALASMICLEFYCVSGDTTSCADHTNLFWILGMWPGAIVMAPVTGVVALVLGPSGTLSRIYALWCRLSGVNNLIMLIVFFTYFDYFKSLPISTYPMLIYTVSRVLQCLLIDLYIAHIEKMRYSRGWDGLHTSLFKTKDSNKAVA